MFLKLLYQYQNRVVPVCASRFDILLCTYLTKSWEMENNEIQNLNWFAVLNNILWTGFIRIGSRFALSILLCRQANLDKGISILFKSKQFMFIVMWKQKVGEGLVFTLEDHIMTRAVLEAISVKQKMDATDHEVQYRREMQFSWTNFLKLNNRCAASILAVVICILRSSRGETKMVDVACINRSSIDVG